MRDILFRGKVMPLKAQIATKEIQTGRWFYGDLLHYAKEAQIWAEDENGTHNFIVDFKTVGQYTGLTDKNGNKIFEGDIVKCHYETYTKQWDENFEVIYFNGGFGLKTFDDKHFVGFGSSTHRTCEIIGNIHDNPELLK